MHSDSKAVKSAVLEYGVPEPGKTAGLMYEKLLYHADSWDVSLDLEAGVPDLVIVDARSAEAYARGHIPGAISLPHRNMNEESVAHLDRSKLYVVYCDGIGCNGSTKGTYRLAKLGFKAKELLGGLDWWKRDEHPIATGSEPGRLRQAG